MKVCRQGCKWGPGLVTASERQGHLHVGRRLPPSWCSGVAVQRCGVACLAMALVCRTQHLGGVGLVRPRSLHPLSPGEGAGVGKAACSPLCSLATCPWLAPPLPTPHRSTVCCVVFAEGSRRSPVPRPDGYSGVRRQTHGGSPWVVAGTALLSKYHCTLALRPDLGNTRRCAL